MKTNVAETVSDPAPMAVVLRALRPSDGGGRGHLGGDVLLQANRQWRTVDGRIAGAALSRWLHKLRKEARKVKMGL
ncbi:MAG TPA: hypothetical protein VG167_18790 [Verrucomicrobiae bacterium]|nr:hypothetical protein [Verrucomicrobiae bacterium]